ncbi:MAG: LacI family DNA-binding transcriptional regulator [Acidobacteriota bacterium]
MAVTLADIARELGVSKMTVSRAINNHPLIHPETRARVLEVARRKNYQPNQHARALVTNRSYLIGIVVPDLMNLYFAEVARAIESIARPAGFQLLICSTDEDAEREIGEVEALLHRTDGLIISSVLPPTETRVYRKMLKNDAKIVLVDRTMKNLRCPTVTTDNVQVGRLATEHLIQLGKRRIGYLLGDASSVSVERLEGYQQALAQHKIRYDESLVRDCGFLESEGYEAMRAWLMQGDMPEAVFAVNDPAAIGAIKALEEFGVRVGRDIAIVGAGNIHYSDMLRVPLTTVSWSRSEMGEQAARLLMQLINGESAVAKAKNIVLSPELIVRNSCGETSTSPVRRRSRVRVGKN